MGGRKGVVRSPVACDIVVVNDGPLRCVRIMSDSHMVSTFSTKDYVETEIEVSGDGRRKEITVVDAA